MASQWCLSKTKSSFSEPFSPDGSGGTESPGVAERYLRTVPHVTYEAVGINAKGHISFDSAEAAVACIREKFLASGPWLTFGNGLQHAGIKFAYNLEGRVLNVAIESASLAHGESAEPVVVYAGNVHHTLKGDTTKDRLESAVNAVSNWSEDLRIFRDLVEGQILKESTQCK